MVTQKSMAEKIIAADSDYILSLKDNHPTLHQQVKNWFETAQCLGFKGVEVSISQRIEKGHHQERKSQSLLCVSVTNATTSWTTPVGWPDNDSNGSAFDWALE